MAGMSGDVAQIADLAEKNLIDGLEKAIENEYVVLIIDSLEDLAQLYKLFDEIGVPVLKGEDTWLQKAKKQLDTAERRIQDQSPNYFFKLRRDLKKVASEYCIEDFWQLLGKIYALRGHIEFDDALTSGHFSRKNSQKTLYKAVQNYILAVGYFGRFADAYNWKESQDIPKIWGRNPILVYQRTLTNQIISRLSKLEETDSIKGIYTDLLPNVKMNYRIKGDWVDEFFGDITELLLQTKVSSSKERLEHKTIS
jgi:hypothetical protein